jgi:hypothetical protein
VRRAGPGLRFNEWIDGRELDGSTVFAHACKLGLEGIVSKRALSVRPLARLAQNEEPGMRGGETGGGRGLEKVTSRPQAHRRRALELLASCRDRGNDG